jgi:3-oxoacyl-[acyl-carrier-protein] synthase-3
VGFGLVAFGEELGEPVAVRDVVTAYTEEVDRVLGYGYRTLHRAADGVGLTDLAVAAGEKALAGAGVDPAEVDLVVLAITDIPEYLYWDAAASVAHRLGVPRAEAVLITQGCTGGIVSLDTVAGRFATHPEHQTALVLAANRTVDTYWNRMETQPMLFSDGAVAAVARRDVPRLRWLLGETSTDGRFADFYRMDVGGGAVPFGTDAAAEPPVARDAWDVMEFFDYDPERFLAFVRQLNTRLREVLEKACARAGVTVADIARAVVLNDNAEAIGTTASELGLAADVTSRALAADHGHLGAADQLFGLGRLDRDGALAPGDLVALAGTGRGMHWAAGLLRA